MRRELLSLEQRLAYNGRFCAEQREAHQIAIDVAYGKELTKLGNSHLRGKFNVKRQERAHLFGRAQKRAGRAQKRAVFFGLVFAGGATCTPRARRGMSFRSH
eukprot:IDg2885t1